MVSFQGTAVVLLSLIKLNEENSDTFLLHYFPTEFSMTAIIHMRPHSFIGI